VSDPDLPLPAASLLDALPDVVMAIDTTARVVYANAAAELRGWSRDEWMGKNALDLIHPDDVLIAMAAMESVQGKVTGTAIELRIAHPTEGWHLFEVIASNRLDDPDLGLLVLGCRDLSERRRWEVAGDDDARFRAVIQHSSAVTMLVDPSGCIQSVSAAITRLTGLDQEALIGARLSSLAASGHEAVLEGALRHRTDGLLSTVEVPCRTTDGTTLRPFRVEVVDLVGDPAVDGYVVTAYDVSELHRARDALHDLATRDPLTGLPNRIALTQAIGMALARRARGEEVGLLFVDLDRFKPVNDLLGHDAGDELLQEVAARLSATVRASDTVARMGGDEFVVLAPRLASSGALEDLARRVERAISEPFTLRAGIATVSASVGAAIAEPASDVSSLLAEADQAMYQVKSARRHGSAVQSRRWNERRDLAAALVGAAERGEMRAHLQPVVACDDLRLEGFEALVRWYHPTGRVLSPGDFLDVAFETGVTTEIDLAVAEQVCSLLRRFDDLDPSTWVSVNMTAADLAHEGLVDAVAGSLRRNGLSPDRLIVEVTEQATLELPNIRGCVSPLVTLHDLTSLGIRVALDDFGTGYSSLTHLRKLDVHSIKIDRSFVSGIVDDETDRSLVSAIIGLAHSLGLRVVAEGVERLDQLELLRALRCDSIQGYVVSPPLAPELVPAWAAEHRGARAVH
jgi:diguanylate cyclase (GGDEF)-like protein/PAS domain S-box-containing protein